MGLIMIFAIIIGILLAVVIMKLLGKAISFAISLAGVCLVVWLVVAGLSFMDARDIGDKFGSSDNLFILSDGAEAITGFATSSDIGSDTITAGASEPDSEDLDNFYKVIVVESDSLPPDMMSDIDSSDGPAKEDLFRSYVEESIIKGDVADNLISAEKAGDLSVYKETLAFKHGIKEILLP